MSTAQRGWFLSVDPGLIHPAYAVWFDGVLVHASRAKVPKATASLERGERVRDVARRVLEAARADGLGNLVTAVASEWPQIYRVGKSKGDPNGLVPLAGVGSWIAGRLDCPFLAPLPAEWIKQVPKQETGDPWSSPRGLLLRRFLTADERAAVTPSHDAVDALGIGLWALGRLRFRNLPSDPVL